MRLHRHRAQRFPFVAGVQLSAIDIGTQIAARTEDLSLLGCFVETTTPFVNGTKVRLRISHGGTIFEAEGTVIYSRERAGMGIAFTAIEPRSRSILDDWLAELENSSDQFRTDLTRIMKSGTWWH